MHESIKKKRNAQNEVFGRQVFDGALQRREIAVRLGRAPGFGQRVQGVDLGGQARVVVVQDGHDWGEGRREEG